MRSWPRVLLVYLLESSAYEGNDGQRWGSRRGGNEGLGLPPAQGDRLRYNLALGFDDGWQGKEEKERVAEKHSLL